MRKPTLPTKKPLEKTKRFNKGRMLLWIVAGILVVLVGGITYYKISHARAVAQEKADFAKAESEIDTLTREVVAELGEPLRRDNKKWCSRPNLKFEEGPLSCDVQSQLYYGAKDHSQINSIFGLVHKQSSLFQSQTSQKITIPMEENSEEKVIQKGNMIGVLECSLIDRVYVGKNPPPGSDNMTYLLDDYVYIVTFNCGGKSLIEHYPINK